MAVDEGLIDWIAEGLAPVAITHRAMMGGRTLYGDGAVFAILSRDGGLWFKADAESDAEWDAADAARFTYDRDGETASMNYRRAPEDVFDDEEALRRWAGLALAAGHRAAAKKGKRATRP